MYYVTTQPLKVDGEMRYPGDPIPEAANWPKGPRAYVDTGRIAIMDEDEAFSHLAKYKGVPVDDLRRDEDEIHRRRNLMRGAATGGSLAPTADGQLREPLAGPVLERVLREAGMESARDKVGVGAQVGPLSPEGTDQSMKLRATRMALGDQRGHGDTDDLTENVHDEADAIHELIQASVATEGTRAPEQVARDDEAAGGNADNEDDDEEPENLTSAQKAARTRANRAAARSGAEDASRTADELGEDERREV